MTSKDIYNRMLFLDNRIFGLKLKMNSNYISNNEYIDAVNSRIELSIELKQLKDKLELNNLRKEKLLNLNNTLCH